MTNLEKIKDIGLFVERLKKESSYESQKVKQLLEAYSDFLADEMVVDAALADISSGNLSCEV